MPLARLLALILLCLAVAPLEAAELPKADRILVMLSGTAEAVPFPSAYFVSVSFQS